MKIINCINCLNCKVVLCIAASATMIILAAKVKPSDAATVLTHICDGDMVMRYLNSRCYDSPKQLTTNI